MADEGREQTEHNNQNPRDEKEYKSKAEGNPFGSKGQQQEEPPKQGYQKMNDQEKYDYWKQSGYTREDASTREEREWWDRMNKGDQQQTREKQYSVKERLGLSKQGIKERLIRKILPTDEEKMADLEKKERMAKMQANVEQAKWGGKKSRLDYERERAELRAVTELNKARVRMMNQQSRPQGFGGGGGIRMNPVTQGARPFVARDPSRPVKKPDFSKMFSFGARPQQAPPQQQVYEEPRGKKRKKHWATQQIERPVQPTVVQPMRPIDPMAGMKEMFRFKAPANATWNGRPVFKRKGV